MEFDEIGQCGIEDFILETQGQGNERWIQGFRSMESMERTG